jgi:chemotaxis protein MotB
MGELIEQGMVRVRRFRFWLEIEINTSILFPSGSAELEADAVPALTAVAAVLRQYRNPVRIEGFTDNVPISTYLFPSNWELSSARAHTVLHLLVREGIAPERLAGVGHGEFKPVASNETPDGRRQNRRVVIVVLADEELEHLRETLLDPAGRTTTGGVDGNGAAAAHGPGAEPGSATAEAPAGGAADG